MGQARGDPDETDRPSPEAEPDPNATPEPRAGAQSPPARPPTPARFIPDWRAVSLVALLIAALVAFVPDLRAWAHTVLVLPVIADALGRPRLIIDGVTIESTYTRSVQVAFGALLALTLVALRAQLLERQARGSRWARRVRIDGSLLLSLTPFLALGPVLAALETSGLFTYPWVFLFTAPLLYVFVATVAVLSLLFGLWMEEGGREHSWARFATALLVFLSIDLFWVAVMQGTTTRLAWWAGPSALAVSFLIYYAVTLGNRLLSHRRATFSLGMYHVSFFGVFLAMWIVDGPWNGHTWEYRGLGFQRTILFPPDAWQLILALLPPMSLTVGAYTIGSFLHRYVWWARPWTHGLNLALVFSQLLQGWVVTLRANDPYDSRGFGLVNEQPLAPVLLDALGGWGYLAWKGLVAIVAVLALDLPFRGRGDAWEEAAHLARGALVALALVPGIRLTIWLAAGL